MTDAPERIWAFYAPEIAENENGATIVAHESAQHGAAPYIRADLHAAEVARLREALAGLLPAARHYGGMTDEHAAAIKHAEATIRDFR